MNYAKAAEKYANQVLKGKVPACAYVKQACQRFKNDLKRWGRDPKRGRGKYWFDTAEANRWCSFLEMLPHVKGQWASRGEKFVLSPYQVFCTVNVFGWRVRKTGKRRFLEVYVEVPRKSGKSYWLACIGIGMLCIDGETGAEVYTGATSEKQAWEVFRPAKMICHRMPDLSEHFEIDPRAKSLVIEKTGSRFEPIIGNPGDGASPSCAIADEFHEHDDSDQVDTMTTGMGAREQPLMIYITTAGSDTGGPCYTKRDEVIKILGGTITDETIFGIIYTIDEGDRWDTVAALKKANPNYGISVSAEFLEGKLKQARRSPSKQNSFRTKHLDQWVGARSAWMNILAFQACRKAKLDIAAFKGERCFIGLDLASRVDVASMAIVFPPADNRTKWAAFFRRWCPEDRIRNAPEGDRYPGWHAAGWIEATPGEVIDFDYIEDELKGMRSDFEIVEVPYDPFQATQFSVHMGEEGEGFPMVEYGATVKNFSEPMKELEALVLKRQIEFQTDPVLLWMMGNVTARLDKKDNIFPTKDRAENKIDDVVALIMAIGRATALRQETVDWAVI